MKKISKILIAVSFVLAAAACVKEKNTEAPSFQIDMENYSSIVLEKNKQVYFIPVSTNVTEDKWSISSSADWCQASRSITAEKGIMVAVSDNTEKEKMRQAQVLASAAGQQYKIIVTQFGYGPAIVVSNVSVGPEGGEVYMDVMANIPLNESLITKPAFNAEDGEDWIRFKGVEETKGFASSRFVFSVDTNELPDKRVATVPVKAMYQADADADTQCTITQSSISVTSTEVFTDDKIVPTSVKASQVSAYEGPVEALIDGSYETYYHSPYEVTTNFPLTWEFTFDGKSRIDYINIMHRGATSQGVFNPGSHWRGQLGTFKVYYKQNLADEATLAQTFDFGGRGGYQTALLDTPIENPAWIMIEIQDDADPSHVNYTDGQYVSCAEVEFFNSNKAEVNTWIDKIFTDRSCSELKEGITKKDIVKMNAVSPYLASNVAIPLLNGSYDAGEFDFRVHSYEPYSDNRVNRALVTRIYSALNNPTGIEVKQGTDILVCVDQIPAGQEVSLAIYGDRADGYGPNYGGGAEAEEYAQNTVLTEGVNTIRVQAGGMAYVLNTIPQADPLHPDTTPVSEYKSVKVHILPGCGTVQGYYDPTRHSEERYKELLNRCTYKYFTIKGKKVMFIFHTNQLRSDFPSSFLSGVEAWDDILGWQHELMGLDQKPWFNNHMAAVSTTAPKAYMDASHRRVQFATTALAKIGSREALLANEGGWGPCHEMGHVNQQAINWKSATESSNNLFSNYCVMRLAGDAYYKTSFSRGKRISDLASDYAAGKPWCLLGDGSYMNEDPELHMRMNWQLWNYYHNCGYNTSFWPDLFEYLRQNPLPSEMAPSYYGKAEDAGKSQLEFYEAACEVAQEDLTEFFDAWGFFVPVDREYDQYGTVRYTVTSDMISAAQTRVREKGYPKAAPIQYLEDRQVVGGVTYSQMGYFTQYKDKAAITKTPKCSISGNVVTLTDCDQAVAVEVRLGTSADGQLKFFSNLNNFQVPSGISLSNCSLWAVQADGKRVAVQK